MFDRPNSLLVWCARVLLCTLVLLGACSALEKRSERIATPEGLLAVSPVATCAETETRTSQAVAVATATAPILESSPVPRPTEASAGETRNETLPVTRAGITPTLTGDSPSEVEYLAPTSASTLPPPEPQVIRLSVEPEAVDPGDTVVLTWDGVGEWATLCPSARYELFTTDDCRQLAPSGEMSFTIPVEAAGFREIHFTLTVGFHNSTSTAIKGVSVRFICHLTWFFKQQPQAGLCPLEPTRSHAAAQHFERGMMIWIEQLGRYYVLDQRLLYEGEIRKQLSAIYDPLEIVADTSTRVEAPPGFYAPVSGFGYVWRGDISVSSGFRESLGWALAPEFGYEAILQCDDALPSGGRSWQTCYLRGPDARVIVLHPLGGWYYLGEG